MGGFLSNVFVRATDTERVQTAVKNVFAKRGAQAPFAVPQALLDQITALTGPASAEISKILSALGATGGGEGATTPVAYLSPPKSGWIGIHPAQDDFEQLAEGLAAELQTVAIGLSVYDDDFLCYHLVQGDRVLDRYNSNPDYFSSDEPDQSQLPAEDLEPLQGNPVLLADSCGRPEFANQIGAVLTDPDWLGNAFGQLEELSTLLGIEGANVTYNDLSDPYPGFEIPDQAAYIAILLNDLK